MPRGSFVLVSAALLVAFSSSTAAGTTESPAATAERAAAGDDTDTGIRPGYPTDVDEFSPLVITTLAPRPIPVAGTDGDVHVAYELQVLNFSPRPATITQIETLRGGPRGKVLADLPQQDVVERTILVADYPPTATPVTEIPPGRVALLVLDDAYATRADVPPKVTHRLHATFGEPPGGQSDVGDKFPTSVTQTGGDVTTNRSSPVVIGPPLAGDDWWAASACCGPSVHRVQGMLPVGGRVNSGERYAVDWSRLDVTAEGLVDPASGRPATFDGDPASNENYLAYGQPLLAVADGTVVAVESGQPDAPPGARQPGLRLDQLGGNFVTIDIGDGLYAFYAHLPPDSVEVTVGERVRKGQLLGRLGNSGNTDEAHLHFHVMRSKLPLSGDNVPFEVNKLTFVGSAGLEGLIPGPDAGPRTNELPLADSIVDFPPVK